MKGWLSAWRFLGSDKFIFVLCSSWSLVSLSPDANLLCDQTEETLATDLIDTKVTARPIRNNPCFCQDKPQPAPSNPWEIQQLNRPRVNLFFLSNGTWIHFPLAVKINIYSPCLLLLFVLTSWPQRLLCPLLTVSLWHLSPGYSGPSFHPRGILIL